MSHQRPQGPNRNMCRNRGNPNFGRPYIDTPIQPTQFELLCERLKLAPDKWQGSLKLKTWCSKHKSTNYIPEALLEVWGWEENEID